MNKPVAIKDAEWEAEIEFYRIYNVGTFRCTISTDDNIEIFNTRQFYGNSRREVKSRAMRFFKLNGISKYVFK
jgi:hypothetical protein